MAVDERPVQARIKSSAEPLDADGAPSAQRYSLPALEAEMARLDAQADNIAAATALLLRGAGIARGMRVLDLGTGLGHVAFQVAELVGPTGTIVGIDQSEPTLAVAEQRRVAAGVETSASSRLMSARSATEPGSMRSSDG